MKYVLQIIIISILGGSVLTVHAQRRAEHTSSGRAAYGNSAPEFKASKKKNAKKKKKAVKTAKRKKVRNNRSSYFHGRPY